VHINISLICNFISLTGQRQKAFPHDNTSSGMVILKQDIYLDWQSPSLSTVVGLMSVFWPKLGSNLMWLHNGNWLYARNSNVLNLNNKVFWWKI